MDLQQLVAEHPELQGCIQSPQPDTWVLTLSGEIDPVIFESIEESGIKLVGARFDATHNLEQILNALETHHAFDTVQDLHLTRIDGLNHTHLASVLATPATNNLRTLNLSQNGFDDSYVDTILDYAHIDTFEKIALNHNQLSEQSLSKIVARAPSKLTVLNLADQACEWNDEEAMDVEHQEFMTQLTLLFIDGNGLSDETLTTLQFPTVDFESDDEIARWSELGRRAVTLKNNHALGKIGGKLSEFDDVDAVRALVRLLIASDGATTIRNSLVLSAYLEVSKLLIDGVLNILADGKTLPVPVAQAIGEVLAERIDGPIADLERLMEAFNQKGLPTQHLDSAVSHVSNR